MLKIFKLMLDQNNHKCIFENGLLVHFAKEDICIGFSDQFWGSSNITNMRMNKSKYIENNILKFCEGIEKIPLSGKIHLIFKLAKKQSELNGLLLFIHSELLLSPFTVETDGEIVYKNSKSCEFIILVKEGNELKISNNIRVQHFKVTNLEIKKF